MDSINSRETEGLTGWKNSGPVGETGQKKRAEVQKTNRKDKNEGKKKIKKIPEDKMTGN